MTPEEVSESVAGLAGTSPVRSGLEGVVGTLVTSLLVAGTTGFWVRKKA